MQSDGPAGAGLLRRDLLVIAGVGVDDAAAPRRHAIEAAFVERLQEGEYRTRLPCILEFNQFLASLDLAGGDVILHIGDN
jgi:hypothetical protein